MSTTHAVYPFESMLEMWRLPMQASCDMINASARMWSAFLPRGASVGDVNIYLPFGNGFRMNIKPDTNWGVQGETPARDLEADVLDDVGSYGRQIGRMMDVLADIAPRIQSANPAALHDLLEVKEKIDRLKTKYDRKVIAAGPLPGRDASTKASDL